MSRPSILTLVSAAVLSACGDHSTTTEPDRNTASIALASHASSFSDWSEPVSLGSAINGPFNEQQAALSKDGLTLFFASNRPGTPGPGPNDIWVSQRACRDCPWGEPVNLGAPVNTPDNDAAPALSRDEHWLFLLSNRPGGMGSSDIWAAYRGDVHDALAWQTPVNLGPGVNTSGFEGGASYVENADGGGAQLYFNHNPAPVGTAGGDIFVSTQLADGSWGTAVPVTELNSSGTDQRPSISYRGLDIYFFSDRAGGAGRFDIWTSTRETVSDAWTMPTNLGSLINTAVAEAHPFIFTRGGVEMLFFSRNMATLPAVDFDLFVSTRVRVGAN